MSCNTGDFRYPLQAHIYYPMIEQSAYGDVQKQWSFDRNLYCNIQPASSKFGEDIDTKILLTRNQILIASFKEDIRKSSFEEEFEMTNILVTDVLDKSCNMIYKETAGPRSGKSTLFEIASLRPFVGPFGRVESYSVILRRSENQGINV